MTLLIFEETKQRMGFDPEVQGPDFNPELPEELFPRDINGFVAFLTGGSDAGNAGEAADNQSGGGDVSGTCDDSASVASGRKNRRGHARKASALPGE